MKGWWTLMATLAPPPLFALMVYLAAGIGRSPIMDLAWPVLTAACLLVGQAALASLRLPVITRGLAGMIYSALCPQLMLFCGLLGSCAAGDCI